MAQEKKKKKKRKLTPMGKLLRGAYLTVMVLSALIVGGYAVWSLVVRPPDIPDAPAVPVVRPTDDPNTENREDEIPPSPTAARKKTFYTFLLVASDQVSSSTDTMIAASYDAVNHKANLISLPRDTLVDRRVGGYHYYRLNGAYANGEAANGKGGGIVELRAAVSAQLGIPIDFYVVVDLKSFVKIVDAVGGVDFEVPVRMDYDAPDQNLHIHYEPKMYYGLTGQQVLEIARCRQNSVWNEEGTEFTLHDAYPDADIGRTRTQQALLKAIAKKLVSWNNWDKLGAFIDIFNESVETNLTLLDMIFFGKDAFYNDALSTLDTATFPGRGDVRYQGKSSFYQYDIPASLALINTMLNPYTQDVTKDMAHMLQVK